MNVHDNIVVIRFFTQYFTVN